MSPHAIFNRRLCSSFPSSTRCSSHDVGVSLAQRCSQTNTPTRRIPRLRAADVSGVRTQALSVLTIFSTFVLLPLSVVHPYGRVKSADGHPNSPTCGHWVKSKVRKSNPIRIIGLREKCDREFFRGWVGQLGHQTMAAR